MTRPQKSTDSWVLGAVLGGTAVVGGVLWTLAAWPRGPRQPTAGAAPGPYKRPGFSDADVEAAARMLASENPRGSKQLHIEQVWTQLRACKPGQSLYDRITAGSGWGPQGRRDGTGGIRPVSTAQPATPALRQLAAEVLAGLHESTLPGARKFFEPAEQDRAFAVAERARKKRTQGEPLTPEEARLLVYRRSAAEVRAKWLSEGARFIGSQEGVDFFT